MTDSAAENFARDGYLVVRRVVPDVLLGYVARSFQIMLKNNQLRFNDGQVEKGYAGYGLLVAETLLDMLTPTVSQRLGLALHPTYTYSRVYVRGAVLEKHIDRPSCEVSATMTIDHDEGTSWPIWLENRAGQDLEVALGRGDMLLYRGHELNHWRHPLEGDYQIQIFFHFVEQGGRFDAFKFDRRPHLGAPRQPRPGEQAG